MKENILSSCGKYSDDLSEIAKLIIKEKSKEEPITQKLITDTEHEVFEAYQQILKNSKILMKLVV